MKILIACEFSGIVREAFNAYHGNYAISCDLLPSEDGRSDYHYQGDVRGILNDGWDMLIAFPPCTDLAVSGARWFPEKRADGRQQASINFFLTLVNANIPKIAIENPVGIMSTVYHKPDQIIQPYQFGHEATKTTCLWLKGLPKLQPTNIVNKGERHVTKDGNSLPAWYNLPPSPTRWIERSRTFTGIAQAMANQWT
jgi:site-specific DNA-cytosine methylase